MQDLVGRLAVIVAIISLLGSAPVRAEDAPGLGGDQGGRIARLRRAGLVLRSARISLERVMKSRTAGLISETEFDREHSAFELAKLEYDEAVAGFLGAERRVVLKQGIKERNARGRIRVRLVLTYRGRDLPPDLAAGEPGGALSDELHAIKDIRVSVLSDGVVVGDPYLAEIRELHAGQDIEARFGLLKDVDVIEVVMSYAGRDDRAKVFLQKDETASRVAISSTQRSQEVELGATGTFDLSLERFVKEGSVFGLAVVGLPGEVGAELVDKDSGAKLSELSFGEGVTARKLLLKVFLPRVTSEGVAIGRRMAFEVVCSASAPGAEDPGRPGEATVFGRIALEIVPRGTARLELQVSNLLQEARGSEPVTFRAVLRNRGTLRVDGVRITAEAPAGWQFTASPDRIASLDRDADVPVSMTLQANGDTGVGEYEFGLKGEGAAAGRRVDADEKRVRVQLWAKRQILPTLTMGAALIGLVAALVVFGRRLSRR